MPPTMRTTQGWARSLKPHLVHAALLFAGLMLVGCTPIDSPLSDAQPPAAAATADSPTLPPTVTSTRVPDTAAATEGSAATAASVTPGLPLLTDDQLQGGVSRLALGFVGTGRDPGLSIALIRRDPQTGQLAAMLLNFGTTAKDGGQPVDSNTVYEIGSITKVFTGILLAEAVNAGQMKLDDPIQPYLPAGVHAPDYKGVPITLADLATHRSGLPRDLNSDSLTDLYTWLNGFKLRVRPGSAYIYSNLGYSLLGDILARNANTDYGTLVFDAVSQPLGLTDTTEMLSEDQTNRLAQGYSFDGSLARYFPISGAMSGAGYLHSTLTDLTHFLIENMQPASTSLAPALSLAQTLQSEGQDPGTGTGLGWEIQQVGRTDERIWKGGATPGFSSYISFTTDGKFGLVLLANGQYVDSLVPPLLALLKATPN